MGIPGIIWLTGISSTNNNLLYSKTLNSYSSSLDSIIYKDFNSHNIKDIHSKLINATNNTINYKNRILELENTIENKNSIIEQIETEAALSSTVINPNTNSNTNQNHNTSIFGYKRKYKSSFHKRRPNRRNYY